MTEFNQDHERWSATAGVLVGSLVSILLFLPIVFLVQIGFHVPAPAPVPSLPLWKGLYKGTASYWVSWGATILICVAPGITAVSFSKTRRFGAGYVVTVLIVCSLVATLVIGYDISGGLTSA